MGVRIENWLSGTCSSLPHGTRQSASARPRTLRQIRRQLEAKLAQGDLALFNGGDKSQSFGSAQFFKWLKDYARVECKTSTASGCRGSRALPSAALRQPTSGSDQTPGDIKAMINALVEGTVAQHGQERAVRDPRDIQRGHRSGHRRSESAHASSRFTRTAGLTEVKGVSLDAERNEHSRAAKEICPEYHPLFLFICGRAFVAESWSRCSGETSSSGEDEQDANRFIVVQHNYMRRDYDQEQEKPPRGHVRAGRALIELVTSRLLESFVRGKNAQRLNSCSYRRTERFSIPGK